MLIILWLYCLIIFQEFWKSPNHNLLMIKHNNIVIDPILIKLYVFDFYTDISLDEIQVSS